MYMPEREQEKGAAACWALAGVTESSLLQVCEHDDSVAFGFRFIVLIYL